MAKNLFILLCGSVLAFPVLALLVQAAPVQEKMEKIDRWRGKIAGRGLSSGAVRINPP